MSEHILPTRIYYAVFATLIVLTAITVAVAFVDLGPINNIVALTIAVTKALLVVLYFMHVRYATQLTWLVVAGSLFWLAVLIVFTLSDMLTREWVAVFGR